MNTLTDEKAIQLGFVPGLEGVIAARTRLSHVDGQKGELILAGFPLEDIAPKATFEEMVYLLWNDRLPTQEQLSSFTEALVSERELPDITHRVLKKAAEQEAPVMDALRMAADTLSIPAAGTKVREPFSYSYNPDRTDVDISGKVAKDQRLVILGKLPSIVAAYWRYLNGLEPVLPLPELSYAAHYLYMLNGEIPQAARVRALETYFNTVIDHGLNASTFTARVITSTGSDLISALVGAIGALKGPLHGGAPGPALDMVFEIGAAERAEAYIREKLEHGERLMGFGHRVYKVRDPRADVLSAAAEQLYRQAGDMELFKLVKYVEKTALALLEEYKPGRKIQTNVEFYTALLLYGLGLPVELFTPTFTLSRAAGWIAHCEEQRRQNRLIRPQSEYVGDFGRRWAPVEERANHRERGEHSDQGF